MAYEEAVGSPMSSAPAPPAINGANERRGHVGGDVVRGGLGDRVEVDGLVLEDLVLAGLEPVGAPGAGSLPPVGQGVKACSDALNRAGPPG